MAVAVSVLPSARADLDSATTPCEDFYQYANGGWLRRSAQLEQPGHWIIQVGLSRMSGVDHRVVSTADEALQQLLARTPALAATTTDPTLRVVGRFYGSCLADTSGTAEGMVGDTTRTSACFRLIRRYLDRALFELFLEQVWPPAARAASGAFWPHMRAAATERFRSSKTLRKQTKQQLVAKRDSMNLLAGMPWSAKLLSLATRPRGTRGPSALPFAVGQEVAARWVYRDYEGLTLSATDFRENVARLKAAPDSIPLPAAPVEPGSAYADSTFLGVALRAGLGGNAGNGSGPVIGLSHLIPPIVDGQIDLGGWYGMIGTIAGHEAAHNWEDHALLTASEAERRALAKELFHGQLVSFGHPFDDAFGILLAHDAFQRALKHWPRTTIYGFTPEQRFFLGVAWGWRDARPPMTLNPISEQTRFRLAVNGVLSSLPTFARAFGCKARAPMAGGRLWHEAPWRGLDLGAKDRDSLASEYEALLKESVEHIGGPGLVITAEQATAFQRRRSANEEHRRQVLFGGAGKTGPAADPDRFYQMIGQELGEFRAVLTPAQQAVFDSRARRWMADPVNFGRGGSEGIPFDPSLAAHLRPPVLGLRYKVAIPGIQ